MFIVCPWWWLVTVSSCDRKSLWRIKAHISIYMKLWTESDVSEAWLVCLVTKKHWTIILCNTLNSHMDHHWCDGFYKWNQCLVYKWHLLLKNLILRLQQITRLKNILISCIITILFSMFTSNSPMIDISLIFSLVSLGFESLHENLGSNLQRNCTTTLRWHTRKHTQLFITLLWLQALIIIVNA